MKRILITLALGFVLTGCSLPSDSVTVPTATPVVTEMPVKVEKKEKIWYKRGEKVNLVSDAGELAGTITLNQVEKEWINDWKNQEAVRNNVNYSYSINVTIDYSKSKRDLSSMTVNCEPCIVDRNGKVVSSTCCVGWSGFPQKAELYSGNEKSTIEVGVQPEQRSMKGCHLELWFSEYNGQQFKVVKYKHPVLSHCKKGAKLLTGKKAARIVSKNGAVYSLFAKKVYYESHIKENSDTPTTFYDLVYDVNAISKPKNSSFIKNITKSRGKAALLSDFVIGVDTINSQSLAYNSDKSAIRRLWSNSDERARYVDETLEVPFGTKKSIITNRIVDDMDEIQPIYVRVRFEFQDEADARSIRKRMKFSGRYVVFQLKITNRELKERPIE